MELNNAAGHLEEEEMLVSLLFFISFFFPLSSLHFSRGLAFSLSVLLDPRDLGLVGILKVYHLPEKESDIPLLEMQGRRGEEERVEAIGRGRFTGLNSWAPAASVIP